MLADGRNRLRNIEATERAKREMEERKRNETKTRRRPEDEDFAAARCMFRPFSATAWSQLISQTIVQLYE